MFSDNLLHRKCCYEGSMGWHYTLMHQSNSVCKVSTSLENVGNKVNKSCIELHF